MATFNPPIASWFHDLIGSTGFFFFGMTLFILMCIILVLLVLIQKGRGGGLSGAFGGSGGNTAFGTKTGDILTWATSVVFGIFLLLAVMLNLSADVFGSKATPIAPGFQTTPLTSGSTSSTPASPASPSTPSNPEK